jgi:hypothetical protein
VPKPPTHGNGKGSRTQAPGNADPGRNTTHVVPVLLWEVDARRAALDAGAVDEHMDLAAGGRERAVEEGAHAGEVGEVAVDDVGGRAGGTDGVCRCGVGAARALDEDDGGGAGLGERARARGPDACPG